MSDEAKPDWRIGLTVKPKYRSHALYYEQCKVRTVHPSGTGGICDPDGVLHIGTQDGRTLLVPASEWVTA